MNANPDIALLFAARAREIAEFLLRRAPQLFAGWPPRTLFAYVFFHVAARTVFTARERGELAAVAFAWSAPEGQIRDRAAAGQAVFAWRTGDDRADALFLAEVAGKKRLFPRLFRAGFARWPDWQRRKIFTFRAGRLVELAPAAIARMLKEGH